MAVPGKAVIAEPSAHDFRTTQIVQAQAFWYVIAYVHRSYCWLSQEQIKGFLAGQKVYLACAQKCQERSRNELVTPPSCALTRKSGAGR